MLGHFAQFFRMLGAFWMHLTPSWCFGTFFGGDFDQFLVVDFGWISGRFWNGFSIVFRKFAKNIGFVKTVVFLCENCYFQGFELAKVNQKSITTPCKFRMGK